MYPSRLRSGNLVAQLEMRFSADCSEDGEPEHVQNEQVLRVAVIGQQEDTQALPTGEPCAIQPNSYRLFFS